MSPDKQAEYAAFVQSTQAQYPHIFNQYNIQNEIDEKVSSIKKKRQEERNNPENINKRMNQVAEMLKTSIQQRQFYLSSDMYTKPSGTIDAVGEKLKEMYQAEFHLKNNLLYNRIIIGQFLSFLRITCSDQFIDVVNSFITMSKSEIYFSISLYEQAQSYPALTRSNLPIRTVKTQWKVIKDILKSDDFYKV